MKHLKTPKSRDIQDITEHFATHGAPIEPYPDKPFGDGGTDTFDGMTPHPSWGLAPPIDVPEPVISMATIGYYSAILITGMGFFYMGIFIGKAISVFLP